MLHMNAVIRRALTCFAPRCCAADHQDAREQSTTDTRRAGGGALRVRPAHEDQDNPGLEQAWAALEWYSTGYRRRTFRAIWFKRSV